MSTTGEDPAPSNGAETRIVAAVATTGSRGTDTRYITDLTDGG